MREKLFKKISQVNPRRIGWVYRMCSAPVRPLRAVRRTNRLCSLPTGSRHATRDRTWREAPNERCDFRTRAIREGPACLDSRAAPRTWFEPAPRGLSGGPCVRPGRSRNRGSSGQCRAMRMRFAWSKRAFRRTLPIIDGRGKAYTMTPVL